MGNLCTVPGPFGASPYTKFLTAAGDGSGSNNRNGNYAAAATDLGFTPAAGFDFDVYSMVVQVSDATTFNQTDYGGISLGLTNGVSFFIQTGATFVPIFSGQVTKQNLDWFRITTDVLLTSWSGTPQTLAILIDLPKNYGTPFTIPSGFKFLVRLNDDLTGLVYHSFCLRGILRPSVPAVQHYWTSQE
jgi:hypothetical protein